MPGATVIRLALDSLLTGLVIALVAASVIALGALSIL
jgi:hypothetical protein